MALDPIITQAVAQALLDAFETAADAGTAPVVSGYDDTAAIPADADAATGANVLLFEVLPAGTGIFATKTDGAPNAVGTFDAVGDDTSANATGTLNFWRLKIDTASTTIMQGTAGTATTDMIINTTAITVSSTVSMDGPTSTITVPEQA
jgi:hypothetical protein